MPIYFHVDYEGIAAAGFAGGVAKKVQTAALKYAYYQVGTYWYRVIMPRHYTPAAKSKYNHTPRKRGYSAVKQKLASGQAVWNPRTRQLERVPVVMGGRIDNAFRGETMRKASSNHSIRVTRNSFVLKVRVPRYITMRRHGSYPNMKRELSTISADEAKLLSVLFMRFYMQFLKANPVRVSGRI